MFHNLQGESKRYIVVLMSAADLIDRERMAKLHDFLPPDARAISVEAQMGNQVAVVIESIEFMPVPHGGQMPLKLLDAMRGRRK